MADKKPNNLTEDIMQPGKKYEKQGNVDKSPEKSNEQKAIDFKVNKSLLCTGLYRDFIIRLITGKEFTKAFVGRFFKIYIARVYNKDNRSFNITCKRTGYIWTSKKALTVLHRKQKKKREEKKLIKQKERDEKKIKKEIDRAQNKINKEIERAQNKIKNNVCPLINIQKIRT